MGRAGPHRRHRATRAAAAGSTGDRPVPRALGGIRSAPEGDYVEIGTSAGYSGLWLALACRATGRSLTTFETLHHKVALAHDTFDHAAVGEVVRLVHGDFLDHAAEFDKVAFCFLDAEKELYQACYEEVVPRLVPGGILIADKVISHQETLQPMIDATLADDRVDAMIVPLGKGELVCRKRQGPAGP